MDRNLALELARVTEASALASARWMGKGDVGSAVSSAVDAMHKVFRSILFNGNIINGIGLRDQTDKLFAGEQLGSGDLPEVDVALDPLESVESVAFSRPNAMAVIAVAPKDKLLAVPEVYMEKIAVGEESAGKIDINLSLEENIKRVAIAKNYDIGDLTVVLLERDRHQELIQQLRKIGVRLHLIPDGDVAASIATALPGTGIDILVGIGGAPEAVMSAAALSCLGGEIQTRFIIKNSDEKKLLQKFGINTINKIYRNNDLVGDENIMFAATGVTDGDLLNGVRFRKDGATTNSLVLRSSSRTRRYIVTEHYFNNQPNY
jgi:fructose-1,6-bisphosphatase II